MMRWLKRHQIAVFLSLLLVATWGALWVVYDYNSPVYQYLKTVGTEPIDGWSAPELNLLCLRFEPAEANAPIKPETAGQTARRVYPAAYVRQIVLVSSHDTCNAGYPKLAWAVAMEWPRNALAPLPSGLAPAKGVIVIDAVSGAVIARHVSGYP